MNNQKDALDPKPASPRKLVTRPPYERMMTLQTLLKSNRYPNCTVLSRRYEVTPKTIQRDIDYLKYNLNQPIKYDPVLKGFYYDGPVDCYLGSGFTRSDVKMLESVLKHLPENIRGEFEHLLNSVIKKINRLNLFQDTEAA